MTYVCAAQSWQQHALLAQVKEVHVAGTSSLIGSASQPWHFATALPLQVGEGMGVLVERCRYLEQSGCASICINSCKVPTQVSCKQTAVLGSQHWVDALPSVRHVVWLLSAPGLLCRCVCLLSHTKHMHACRSFLLATWDCP